MAVTKEAIVIALDVGVSMHEVKDSGSVLENAKNCVNMIIQRKIFSESKDELALLLFGTSKTVNNFADDGGYDFSNISIIEDLKPASWELLEQVNTIQGSDISTDNIKENALLAAIQLLQSTANNKKFFSRRILFLSRFDLPFNSDKVPEICEGLKLGKIDLNIIGPSSFTEEEISNGTCPQTYADHSIADASGATIKSILKEVNGESYSFSEAIPALIYFQKKKVQSLPWNANLDIGTNLTIPISAYTKVNESKPKSWKPVYARKLNAKLEKKVTYLMNNEEQTEVSKDNIIPAFKYGTTLVPYTDEDKQNMDYQSGEKGMKVLGFTKAENVHRYHYIGDKSMYVFGQKNRELAGVILAPFVQALKDTNMVAIVRYVYSARSAPKIGFLSPKIKDNYECLIFIPLPFMEDLRHFVFAPLDADKKNIPSDEQLSAVDDLITSMNLSTAAIDEEGNLGEELKSKYTVNPYLQRLYQCLQFRALHPEKPLPPIAPHIEAIINPPSRLVKMSEPAVDKIKELFPLKELFPKAPKETEAAAILSQNSANSLEKQKEGFSKKNKDRRSDSIVKSESSKKRRKISSDNSEDVYPGLGNAVGDKIVKVGSVTPVKDFQYLLDSQTLQFGEACKQIIDVVYKYLKETSLKHFHIKILDICKELRHTSLKRNDAAQYNSYMKSLQTELLRRDAELWIKIKNERIGLLSNEEVKLSTVTPSEADEFLAASPEDVKSVLKVSQTYDHEDDMDLLDEI
ncbi:hypothetical protein JTE90_014200 [Oedothorax gibbosus]|uniref:Ku domain-containing protein n=1 Tax=Oedothorax gibbosus TaxID=931172 RepID=A0AAV6U3P2_9ARAC|nr:hypothetical protein JTE90_014200 [Oedothorax gibbosus]